MHHSNESEERFQCDDDGFQSDDDFQSNYVKSYEQRNCKCIWCYNYRAEEERALRNQYLWYARSAIAGWMLFVIIDGIVHQIH